MRRLFLYVGKHPWQTVPRVLCVTPFVLSFAFVYLLASVFGVVPRWSDCRLDHVKTISIRDIDFEVSNAECFALIDAWTPTVVRASQRGDWFQTKVFEYGGIVKIRIEAIDNETIRISIPEKFGNADRGIDAHQVLVQRSKWGDINLVYDQAGPDEGAP